jgi:hypothetical protein
MFDGVLGFIGGVINAIATIVAAFIQKEKKRKQKPENDPRSSHNLKPEILSELNSLYRDRVKIIRFVENEPKLIDEGFYALTENQNNKMLQFEIKRKAEKGGIIKANDWHGIVFDEPVWTDNPVTIRYYKIKYSGLCILLEDGVKFQILSANVLAFSDDTKELILHRRAEKSRTYPGALHTFGGAFIPDGEYGFNHDKDSLISTAEREFLEELSIPFTWTSGPMAIVKEIDTGFFHLILLGVNIRSKILARAKGGIEGHIKMIGYADLKNQLLSSQPNWVPTGKIHVLLWLALGAYGSEKSNWSGHNKPQKIFKQVMKELKK